MTVFLVLLVTLVAGLVVIRRARRRTGSGLERTFTVEPPAGRLGKRKGDRL